MIWRETDFVICSFLCSFLACWIMRSDLLHEKVECIGKPRKRFSNTCAIYQRDSLRLQDLLRLSKVTKNCSSYTIGLTKNLLISYLVTWHFKWKSKWVILRVTQYILISFHLSFLLSGLGTFKNTEIECSNIIAFTYVWI